MWRGDFFMETLDSRAKDGQRAILRNRLLAFLPEEDLQLIEPHCTIHAMKRGAVLFHPGDNLEAVYLPCDGMVSLIVVTPSGETAETGLIGAEGAVGGLISSGHRPAYVRAAVQIPGDVLRISIDDIETAKAKSPRVHDLFARYADCLLAQLLQTIACNALHSLEQRLPRWLLSVHQRQGTDELPLTQEYLSEMLGVQRTTVTATAAVLQQRGLIQYYRGRIRLLDLEALENASCRCHASVRLHYDRLLPGTYAAIPKTK
jgi:CRP-like cAMP-binding protein